MRLTKKVDLKLEIIANRMFGLIRNKRSLYCILWQQTPADQYCFYCKGNTDHFERIWSTFVQYFVNVFGSLQLFREVVGKTRWRMSPHYERFVLTAGHRRSLYNIVFSGLKSLVDLNGFDSCADTCNMRYLLELTSLL